MSQLSEMTAKSPKIVIIGAGITGVLCASILRKTIPQANILIMDKARGAGGRMTTTRNDTGNKADLGAQYITTSQQTLQKYADVYQPLISKGVLQNLTAVVSGMKAYPDDTVHLVAPDGLGSVVKYFLADSEANINLNCLVSEIIHENNQFKIETKGGKTVTCDVVISTMPIPQFLALTTSDILCNESQLKSLKSIQYSTRFILIWFYDKGTQLPLLDWTSKYLDDDVFRYVTLDNLKRNRNEEAPTVVFHTSIQFGAKNISKGKMELESELTKRAEELFPELPTPGSRKCHKWLYSQVLTAYPDKPGCVVICSKPTLILAGDAFFESNFNGCITSARAAVDAVRTHV